VRDTWDGYWPHSPEDTRLGLGDSAERLAQPFEVDVVAAERVEGLMHAVLAGVGADRTPFC